MERRSDVEVVVLRIQDIDGRATEPPVVVDEDTVEPALTGVSAIVALTCIRMVTPSPL